MHPIQKLMQSLPAQLIEVGLKKALNRIVNDPALLRELLTEYTPLNTIATSDAAEQLRKRFDFGDAEFKGAALAMKLHTWKEKHLWELQALLKSMGDEASSLPARTLATELDTYFAKLDQRMMQFHNIMKDNNLHEPCPPKDKAQ